MIYITGETLLWPLQMTYIHRHFDKSLSLAGFILLFHFGAGLIGNILGGILFDKWGGEKVLFTSFLFSLSLVLMMCVTTNFSYYVVLLLLLGFSKGLYFPLARAIPLTIWSEGGRNAVNIIYVAENVGVALGSALAGWVASFSFQWSFIGNSITYMIVILLFPFILKGVSLQPKIQTKNQSISSDPNQSRSSVSFQIWTLLSLLVFGLATLVIPYIQWSTTIPNYLSLLHIPLSSYGLLWTVNGLLVVLGQPLLSWMIRRFSLSLSALLMIGSSLFFIAMMVTSGSRVFPLFLLDMVIITWGEMLVWPSVPTIAARIAPFGKEGLFQGIATGAHSAGRMVGPLLGGFLYEALSPSWMLVGMACLCFCSILCFLAYTRLAKKADDHQLQLNQPLSSQVS